MRNIVSFTLVFLVLWLPYRLAVLSHDDLIRSSLLGFEFTADQASASPVHLSGAFAPYATNRSRAEVLEEKDSRASLPVGHSGELSRSPRSDDWIGADGRAPIVQASPNPAAVSTQIAFTLPHATPALVRLFDAYGHAVATLADDYREEGTYLVTFDGSRLLAGRYVCVLETNTATVAKEIVLSP